ncbi:hypothetical protein MRX96_032772 [Rhipicephalus microplus]
MAQTLVSTAPSAISANVANEVSNSPTQYPLERPDRKRRAGRLTRTIGVTPQTCRAASRHCPEMAPASGRPMQRLRAESPARAVFHARLQPIEAATHAKEARHRYVRGAPSPVARVARLSNR